MNAENHAKRESRTWPYGQIVIASRELDTPGELRVMSVWNNGERVMDFGSRGEWRKVRESPI